MILAIYCQKFIFKITISTLLPIYCNNKIHRKLKIDFTITNYELVKCVIDNFSNIFVSLDKR